MPASASATGIQGSRRRGCEMGGVSEAGRTRIWNWSGLADSPIPPRVCLQPCSDGEDARMANFPVFNLEIAPQFQDERQENSTARSSLVSHQRYTSAFPYLILMACAPYLFRRFLLPPLAILSWAKRVFIQIDSCQHYLLSYRVGWSRYGEIHADRAGFYKKHRCIRLWRTARTII